VKFKLLVLIFKHKEEMFEIRVSSNGYPDLSIQSSLSKTHLFGFSSSLMSKGMNRMKSLWDGKANWVFVKANMEDVNVNCPGSHCTW